MGTQGGPGMKDAAIVARSFRWSSVLQASGFSAKDAMSPIRIMPSCVERLAGYLPSFPPLARLAIVSILEIGSEFDQDRGMGGSK